MGYGPPRRRQFLPKVGDPDVVSSALSARAWVSSILPDAVGQELGGIGPGRASQRAGVLRVIGRRSPYAIGCRPAGDLSWRA